MRLKPEDLKIGMVTYEGRLNYKATVISTPECTINDYNEKEWRWQAIGEIDNIVNYVINEKHSHYGPSIYSKPAYVTTKEWRELDGAKNY